MFTQYSEGVRPLRGRELTGLDIAVSWSQPNLTRLRSVESATTQWSSDAHSDSGLVVPQAVRSTLLRRFNALALWLTQRQFCGEYDPSLSTRSMTNPGS